MHLVFITGPMKASKSELVALFYIPKQSVVIKPQTDDTVEFSRSGLEVPHTVVPLEDPQKIIEAGEGYPFVYFDEVHFFEPNALKSAIFELKNTKEKIFLSGLEFDAVGNKWPTSQMIKNEFDPRIIRLTARCDYPECKLPATEMAYDGDYSGIDTDKSKYRVFCKLHVS